VFHGCKNAIEIDLRLAIEGNEGLGDSLMTLHVSPKMTRAVLFWLPVSSPAKESHARIASEIPRQSQNKPE